MALRIIGGRQLGQNERRRGRRHLGRWRRHPGRARAGGAPGQRRPAARAAASSWAASGEVGGVQSTEQPCGVQFGGLLARAVTAFTRGCGQAVIQGSLRSRPSLQRPLRPRRANTPVPRLRTWPGFPSEPAPAQPTDFPTVQVHRWVHLGTPVRPLSDGSYFSSSPSKTLIGVAMIELWAVRARR